MPIPGGRVDQDPVEGLAGLAQQRTEALLLHESVLLAHRGRQQEQARQGRMLRGVGQLAEALRHVRERDSGLLGHAERDVEIPQADVGIDAQDALALSGKTGRDPGAERRFARAALAGNDGNRYTHVHVASFGVSFL